MCIGVLCWGRSGKFFLFEVYNLTFLVKFPSSLFAFFNWCLIRSRTWVGSNFFIFKNFPFFHWKDMSGLLSKQHFVKLIWDSLIIFVLSRSWIFLFWFKHGTSLNYFVKDFVFFFMKYFFHIMNRMRFFLFIEVGSGSNDWVNSISLKSCCFGVEISFWTFVKTFFLYSMRIISPRSWSLDFFYTSDRSKSVCGWSKTRRNWLASSQFMIVLSWSGHFLSFSFDHFSIFPSGNSFIVETWLRVGIETVRIWLRRFYFFHLVILVFPKTQIINRYGWYWLF